MDEKENAASPATSDAIAADVTPDIATAAPATAADVDATPASSAPADTAAAEADANAADDKLDVDTAPADAGLAEDETAAVNDAEAAMSPAPKAVASPRFRKGGENNAIVAHLFGGSASPRVKQKKQFITKEDLERIAKPRKPLVEPSLDKDCTFKPAILENSRKIVEASGVAEGAEPRFHTLAKPQNPETKQKLEIAKKAKDDAEMAPCTFRPATNWADPGKVLGEWSKSKSRYQEHVPDRYIKAKDDLTKKKAAADADIKRSDKSQDETPTKAAKKWQRSPGSPGSPRPGADVTRWPASVESPRSPLNAYRNIPDAPGQHRGMATHVARVAAGRGIQELKQGAFRSIDEASWIERRSTTTPVPFRSHTGLRQMQRESNQVDPGMVLNDPVFEDLHRMLQSLQLNAQRK